MPSEIWVDSLVSIKFDLLHQVTVTIVLEGSRLPSDSHQGEAAFDIHPINFRKLAYGMKKLKMPLNTEFDTRLFLLEN